MASLLDSVIATHGYAVTIASSRSSASAISSVPGCRISPTRLPGFRRSLVTRSVRSVSQGPSRKSRFARGGRVVCEAQDTAAASVDVSNISDSDWQSLVLESENPVLVEFWAPWCGPCRMMHPIVDQLAKDFAGKFSFYKVNTDESPNIANQYAIRSIPTVMIFKEGEKKDTIIGAVPKETLEKSIEKFL